ncbi:hypothetical protein CGMCC3_g11812 [Colletotrichum fructicola]|nr:uncharacterized protein CGMCC3_g11812 [Colletotrichum fructicola]KAE9572112.1 hypothetical protein CGMCC3_g11812 [Colletotrichum fructicola]
MSWLGARALKKYPTPVLKPMAPFFAAGRSQDPFRD